MNRVTDDIADLAAAPPPGRALLGLDLGAKFTADANALLALAAGRDRVRSESAAQH